MSQALLQAIQAGDTSQYYRILADANEGKGKFDLHVTDPDRRTVLHWAVKQNDEHLCVLLLRAGFDVNAADSEGRTALHYSAIYGHPRIAWAMVSEAPENGQDVDLDARDEQGRTALHACADTNRASDAAGTLIHCGADASAKDNEGLSAEAYARNKGMERVAQAIAYATTMRSHGNIETLQPREAVEEAEPPPF